jgi:hypothetical protein
MVEYYRLLALYVLYRQSRIETGGAVEASLYDSSMTTVSFLKLSGWCKTKKTGHK